jgi:hypothetical protein
MLARGWLLHPLEEHLERHAVMQVFAGMDLVADVDAVGIGMVEDRRPAAGEFVEGGLDKAGRALRPRIDEGPGERAREGRMRLDAEMLRRRQRHLHLLDRPFLPRLRIAAHFGCRKTVEGFVIGRMHGNQLALQMGGKLGDLDAVLARHAGELVAIILRRRRLLQVDQLARPGRHLHALVAGLGRPFGNRIPGIERGGIARELPEEQPGALDRFHVGFLP